MKRIVNGNFAIILLLFFVLSINLVFGAQFIEEEDIKEILGYKESVIAKNVDIETVDGGTKIIFSQGKKSYLNLAGNVFENIGPQTEYKTSFIVVEKGKITEADFYIEKSGKYIINGYEFYAPMGSRIYFKKGSETILIGDAIFTTTKNEIRPLINSDIEELPRFLLDADSDLKIAYWGVFGINGFDMDGILVFQNGEFSLSFRDRANELTIDGFKLQNNGNSYTQIFFDGKEHKNERYISIGSENIIFKSLGEELIVELLENNEIAKIEKFRNDYVAFKILDGEIRITDRKNEGRTPKGIIKGNVIIDEDYKSFSSDGKEVLEKIGTGINEIKGDFKKSSTSPFVFSFEDKDGNPIRDKKLIVTNFNEYVWVNQDIEEGETGTNYFNTNIPKKASVRLSVNYPDKEGFEKRTGIKLIIPRGYESSFKPEHYRLLNDFYDSMPEDVRKNIKTIQFIGISWADADGNGRVRYPINLFLTDPEKFGTQYRSKEDFNAGALTTLRHEVTHLWSFKKEGEAIEISGVRPDSQEALKVVPEHVQELKQIMGVFNPENVQLYDRGMRDIYLKQPLFGYTYGYATRRFSESERFADRYPETISTIGEFADSPQFWKDFNLMDEINPHYKIYRALPAWLWKHGGADQSEIDSIYSQFNLPSDKNSLLGYIEGAKNDPWLHDQSSLSIVREKERELGWSFLTNNGRRLLNSAKKTAAESK